mmetsp:Transcript_103825/g.179310  ORF Transcript_103825/g.179310 Transcript_103825/m.179310 type:complete len:83 (+) Transcript_103825:980-1228(+)
MAVLMIVWRMPIVLPSATMTIIVGCLVERQADPYTRKQPAPSIGTHATPSYEIALASDMEIKMQMQVAFLGHHHHHHHHNES